MNVTHDEGDRIFLRALLAGTELSAKSEDAELAPAGREIGRGELSNGVRTHRVIIAGRVEGNGAYALTFA